ncbi:hypothetical protein K9U39_14815 [Rhodoblastus acidophilus]|uniref:Uncharacterized protein n=1 Tax=Candidatus Rhodoblastus alkanivorans TaxID=2954117 RepID=A0ABS9ZF59_9HYPH|nr:hypothetical protein [Candidatus Rhodoblastus alkanivorans]MCI4679401.1 hypothetical protein [Candidatus Rhodoblastus alkanivorans]MCI4684877.1 hypothetical protein [Candidatus Rhodoblastus alkanivorans]MDI4642201.1 hypothetical protein [Rhodoblastus acidophilus]
MRKSIGLAAAFGLVLFASTAIAAQEGAPRHHHRPRHHGVRPAPPADARYPVGERGTVAPSPRGNSEPEAGDGPGLSRDPDDCNMGCIGGNPD